MRCWKMRCWNIWRCWGPIKKKEKKLENKVWRETWEGVVLWFLTFFSNDPDLDNTISIEEDQDTETWEIKIVVGGFYSIEDEDARALWREMRESLDAEHVLGLFNFNDVRRWPQMWGIFLPDALAQFNTFINNPTEEQINALKAFLEEQHDRSTSETLPIVEWGRDIIYNDWDGYQFGDWPIGAESVLMQIEQRREQEQDGLLSVPFTFDINWRQYSIVSIVNEANVMGVITLYWETLSFLIDFERDEDTDELFLEITPNYR